MALHVSRSTPDGPIPGYFLRRGESYVVPLCANARKGVGVYDRVRLAPGSSGVFSQIWGGFLSIREYMRILAYSACILENTRILAYSCVF